MFHLLIAAILGSVQGLTEFLPVSSTAHLIISEKLLNVDQATYGLSFDMFTNIGTIAALLIFFWADLKELFGRLRLPKGKPLSNDEKVPWYILLATIPVGLVGFLLEKRIETQFRSLLVIAISLAVVGILMILAENYSKKLTRVTNPTPVQVLLISLSQCLAFVPGVSRSGITISTAIFLKLDRVTAARYSFMLSIPITLIATLKKLLDFGKVIHTNGIEANVLTFYVIGALFSFVVGYFALKFLLKFYRNYSLATFAYYRIGLALVLIILIGKFGL